MVHEDGERPGGARWAGVAEDIGRRRRGGGQIDGSVVERDRKTDLKSTMSCARAPSADLEVFLAQIGDRASGIVNRHDVHEYVGRAGAKDRRRLRGLEQRGKGQDRRQPALSSLSLCPAVFHFGLI